MDAYVKCDAACNARAYVTYTIDTGKVLDFCGHHANALDEQLWPYVINVDDRRAELLKKVDSSANA